MCLKSRVGLRLFRVLVQQKTNPTRLQNGFVGCAGDYVVGGSDADDDSDDCEDGEGDGVLGDFHLLH